jgi:Ca2+ transporting ATPase
LSVDGVLIHGNNVSADESSITGNNWRYSGESNEVRKRVPENYKDKCNPFLVSGSKLMEGTGDMLVLAVGRNSQYGMLKMKIQQDQDDTPLQEKLSTLADQIGSVGLVSAILTFSAMFIHYIYDCAMGDDFVGEFISWGTLN